MKDRMTLGHDADVAETAALTLADPDTERRMFDELDRETDRKVDGGRIGAALRRLNTADRAFACAVLDGRTWREMGCPERTFYWRLKNLKDFSGPKTKAETDIWRWAALQSPRLLPTVYEGACGSGR